MASATIDPCRFCLSDTVARTFKAREMMIGHRDWFGYHECGACRSINLDDRLPEDALERYYGPGYYSFDPNRSSAVKRFLIGQRDRASVGRFTPLGKVLSWAKPDAEMALMRSHGLARDAVILDVGCGAGHLLDRLANVGYINLLGIDPFITADTQSAGGVNILRRAIDKMEGRFDLVMFNHSLEHVVSPRVALADACRLLGPSGVCVVRIPTVSSAAWEEYGTDWVQLDAPRHVSLPSREGMRIAGEAAGMQLDRAVDDSSGFQFWASEQYRRDIPLSQPQVFTGMFSKKELGGFTKRARTLNAQSRGDQSAFIFRPA
ncbi:class I SAM-dependent methyltransferase [Sphingomonas sp. R86521]|uniref:class I SAM-dependent methyltransferase n=1 Tax=Sphingomonas sp. R86521 TaxID=3093860 RepID=UPI0036D33697